MPTILLIFCISLGLALILTPLIGNIAKRLGVVDPPSGRKVHTRPIPRIGGVAIYLAFIGPFLAAFFHQNSLFANQSGQSLLWICAGATMVFLMGFTDDIFRLRPLVKLAVQTFAAGFVYAGGMGISQLQLPWGPIWSLGWLSLPVTVFWFLLVVNAVNLIDGLDGLAAGISLFASITLLALAILGGRFVVAAGLAALAGACLGFLRYNFNPASIFMGDSGSYFIGFMLAALSILGSIKSQTTVAILIPVVALGLPLMDTVLAPIRRFLLGKEMFQPDKSHIHHKLLKLGFSQKRAVLVMYGATILLGVFALLLVNAHDQKAALLWLVLAVSIIVGFRKLGYLEYVAIDKIIGYFQDVSDVMGLRKDRRTFLNHQISINDSVDINQLWQRIIAVMELLRIDQAEIRLDGQYFGAPRDLHFHWRQSEVENMLGPKHNRVMSVYLPLVDGQKSYGTLFIRKEIMIDAISHYTLRRIEHLRRSIVRKLKCFENRAKTVEQRAAADEYGALPEARLVKSAGSR